METSMCAYTLHLVSALLRYPRRRTRGVVDTNLLERIARKFSGQPISRRRTSTRHRPAARPNVALSREIGEYFAKLANISRGYARNTCLDI